MDDGTHCEVEGEKHLSLFSSQFCRIMVYKGGHVNPPCELWTRSNIGALDVNVGKPIPLFEEFPSTGKTRFEFKGWYEIVRWTVFKGGSPEIVEFMQRRGDSKRSKDAWRWREALGSSWAKVEVVPVHDDALGNPMQRVATSQAA